MADPPRRNGKLDERVSIPLDPRTALRGLMAVDPETVNGTAAKTRKKKPAKNLGGGG